jgi:hypothetical protein
MTDIVFYDEPYYASSQKQRMYEAWQHFIRSGFNKLFFTDSLYKHLITHCRLPAHAGRERFYLTYFQNEARHLRAFMGQFAGDRLALTTGDYGWLQGQAQDLNYAMCEFAAIVYGPVTYLLDELERYHQEMARMWSEFTAPGEPVSPPPGYKVDTNTRHLLQYAIQAALQQKRPLVGLQLQIPEVFRYEQGQEVWA